MENIDYSDIVKVIRYETDEEERCNYCGEIKFNHLRKRPSNTISVHCVSCCRRVYFSLTYSYILRFSSVVKTSFKYQGWFKIWQT